MTPMTPMTPTPPTQMTPMTPMTPITITHVTPTHSLAAPHAEPEIILSSQYKLNPMTGANVALDELKYQGIGAQKVSSTHA
jgi:hypothetical protein